MELEEMINQNYTLLNENDKDVCKQILTKRNFYATCTCEQIAQDLHISRATLLRLCRKINLVSFSDLKLMLKKEEKKSWTLRQENIFDTYHVLIDELRKFSYRAVCERIYASDVVYIYGTGNEQKALATECKRSFLAAGKCVVDLFDYGEIAFMKHSFQANDVFLIISLSGETKEGIAILQMIAPTNITCISITRLANNTISSMCDLNLYVATSFVAEGSQNYELVSVFYVLLDLLFINYLDYCQEVTS